MGINKQGYEHKMTDQGQMNKGKNANTKIWKMYNLKREN